MADLTDLLKPDSLRLRDLWRSYRTFRRDWDSLRHRRKNVLLEPHLKHWVSPETQFRSPDLEYYGGQFVQERMLRPTKIDAIPLSTKESVIEDIRDCRTWYGYEWKYQNRNRRLDRARSQGQVYYGLAVERLSWTMPGEPDDDELDDFISGEPDDDKPAKKLKARDAYFMAKGGHSFAVDPVHPFTVEFAPIHDPHFFREETLVSLYSARKLKNGAGKFLDLSQDRMIVFRGDEEPLQEWNDRTAMSGAMLHHITQAWLDEKTEKWMIAEYVTLGTGGENSEPDFTNGVVLKEPDVVPFNACPYEVIPSGEYDALATDPHLAFRPRMYPLYVDIDALNQVETKIWAYAVRSTNSIAMSLEGMNELGFAWLEQQFGMAEGEGAERGMTLPIPNNGPGEWPMVPKLLKIPFEIDQSLMVQRQAIYDSIKKHEPNRFQTGNVSRTEVAEGKATAFANTQEASALPAESDLAMQDAGTRAQLEKMGAAICYWPEDKPYPWMTTGDEPLMTDENNAPPKAGGAGFVNAKKIGHSHEIIVWTKNQTQAEEQIEALMAFQDEAQHISTRAQTIARRGYDDVQTQLRLLETDRQIEDMEPHVRQLMTARNQAIFDGASGANTGAMLGLPPGMAPTLPGDNAFPGAVAQTTPRSGSGTPNWADYYRATGGQQDTPTPAAPQPGMGIAPSPNGSGQGSSPSGNGLAGR